MINCSCLAEHRFFTWHMDYKVQKGDTWESISSKIGFFVLAMSENVLIPSVIVTLDVLWGCSNNADMVTYKVQNGDTVFIICSRFKAKETKTVLLNGLDNPDIIRERDILFIPTPAGFNNLTSIDYHNEDTKAKKTPKSRIFIVVGAISAALVVVLLSILLVFWKNHMKKRARQPIASSRRLNCLHCYLASCPQHRKSEESMVSSIGSDKATVLPYNEIREATSNFSRSLIIGQGSYGLVYLGKLRGTIELIGYAAGGESLFLVYEFSQNGALSNHLHNPALRGHKPLPWTTRVQIALDAAKGLEYIHERTKPYHVHRDSDVYAFGVVLMELLTGQPALSKDASPENEKLSEHRSVVQYVSMLIGSTLKQVFRKNKKRKPVARVFRLRVEAEIREGIDIRICYGGNVKRKIAETKGT
ncbi:lysM domain receptor-like kinase 3 [Populus alba x Populus x berolinensis]|nr:lysM domain receptor-like kinase 3 [Populus alba x Populus x berolinensis]